MNKDVLKVELDKSSTKYLKTPTMNEIRKLAGNDTERLVLMSLNYGRLIGQSEEHKLHCKKAAGGAEI